MKKSLRIIHKAFDGKLVGSKRMQNMACDVVAKMPNKIFKKITKTCWFISSLDDAWGFTLTGNDLKNQHLVFLSDELFRETPQQIRYTIAHEIGHVILGHRNSILKRQSKAEVREQEKEADAFTKQFLIY